MSSIMAPPSVPAPGAPLAPPSQAEAVIEQRLRQARRQVKGVDVAAALLRLAVGTLLFLLAFAVLDHWLVTGGLGVLGRTLAAMVFFAGAGVYVAREILPSCVFRIHPLFAAQALERGRPGVKNSLINFLLLREHRQEMRPVVYDAVQRRAAADLAGIEVEAAVDRAHVFRLGYVLAGALAVCCLYFVLSPKSPFTSAARLLWPFGRIPAPTRVTVDEITPGNAVVYLDDAMTVTGVVRGLRDGEPVTLFFSTTDGQLINEAIPMSLPTGEYRHRADLPPGGRGFQQSGTYILAAGDFRSEPFRVDVQTAPAIVVDRVVLEYPGYTGLAPRTLRRQGDLRAIEGTRATIHAEANQPIRRAEIDLGSDGKHAVGMKVNDRTASGLFTLRLDPNDPTRPQHDSYQLRLVDTAGRVNPRPIRHRIDVIRDLPPEITLLAPREQQSQVPADGQLVLELRAEDPDFGLKRVSVRAVSSGRELETPTLLAQSAGGAGFRGPFTAEYEFRPGDFSLQPGDRVLYWAEAEDVRQPTPGLAETDRRWIEITAPTGQPAPERRQPTPADPEQGQPQPGQTGQEQQKPPLDKPSQQEEQPAQPQPGQEPNDQPTPDDAQATPQQGDQQQGEDKESTPGGQAGQGEGTPGGKPEAGKMQPGESEPGQTAAGEQGEADSTEENAPVNPDTNPGDAIDKILEHRRQQQGDQPEPSKPQPTGEESGEKTPGQQKQKEPGAEPSEPSKPGEKPKEEPGEKPGEKPEQKPEQKPGQMPKEEPGEKPGEEPGEQAAGEQGQEQPGQEPKPQDQPGAKPGDGQQKGDQAQSGEEPEDASKPGTGDQPAGQPKPEPGQDGGQEGGEQEATPGEKPAGAESSPSKPQGGPADNSGDQPPGQMQPSPGSDDPAAKRQPGTTDPAREKSSDPSPAEGDAAGSAERSGGEADPATQSGQREPGAKPQDGGTQPEDTVQQQSPGPGQQSQQPSGSPSPQEDNVSRPKDPGQAGGESTQRQEQSPSISPKQSDSQGDTAGDRSGGGEEGGGQQANQPGVGSPGSQTDAESGAGVSQQQGDGEPGTRPGDQMESDQPTGSSAPQPGGTGQGRGKPGGQQPSDGREKPSDGTTPPGQSIEKPRDGGQAGEQVSEGPGARGSGTPTQGGDPDAHAAADKDRPSGEPGAEAANLEFARKQTQLALEYLKDHVDKPDSNLLEQLGWSEAEAQRFIEQWEQLRRRAGRDDAEGGQARRELEQALRSLGLSPRGTELKRGTTSTERIDSVRESGRFRPPSDWAEQFEAYTRSIAEGER